ncbi:PQQ-binding-like beta-propeller repeat protein [bacterium AH-315-E10]|nr:PQQ-binding-like beta-propeller repeat protein [bacterium AH-315-E10]
MSKHPLISCIILLFSLCHSLIADPNKDALDPMKQWAQFRGPLFNGVAPHGNPPVNWSEDKNIRWKTAIPGKGLSTPVVWGNQVFITTALAFGKTFTNEQHQAHGAHNNVPAQRQIKFMLLCIDSQKGTILWKKTLLEKRPHDSSHETGSWASNTVVTDGKKIYAFFGSNGLYCLDMKGKLIWKKQLGLKSVKHSHGEGSSPALSGKFLIINWDHDGDSFISAFEKTSGNEIWKMKRDEGTSWSTPLVIAHKGKHQIIIAASKRIRSYDRDSGKLIWECAGLSGNVVATPVYSKGVVYVMSSYEFQAALAINIDGASGDISKSKSIIWKLDRFTPYVPSPLLYDGRLYFNHHLSGTFSSLDAKTGRILWGPTRIQSIPRVFASPIAAADRVYLTGKSGNVIVIRHGDKPVLLARNQLNDSFSASPSIVGDSLYLRGEKFLYCIAEKK